MWYFGGEEIGFEGEEVESKKKNMDISSSKISEFLKSHNCYELMPASSKIVVLDIGLAVKSAFQALGENRIKSAPLWDPTVEDYAGMITVSDFIEILLYFHKVKPKENIFQELEKHQIRTWREIIRKQRPPIDKLIATSPEESLYEATKKLINFRIHRLPIVDIGESNTILHIATHYGIISFLMEKLKEKPPIFSRSVESLGIGTYENLITVNKETPLYQVLDLLLEKQISAIPIVDDNGKAVDIYTKSNVTSLIKQVTYDFLDKPVGDVLEYKNSEKREMYTFNKSETLEEVLQKLIKTRVYRLICIDSNDAKLNGILSLRDLLQFFLNN